MLAPLLRLAPDSGNMIAALLRFAPDPRPPSAPAPGERRPPLGGGPGPRPPRPARAAPAAPAARRPRWPRRAPAPLASPALPLLSPQPSGGPPLAAGSPPASNNNNNKQNKYHIGRSIIKAGSAAVTRTKRPRPPPRLRSLRLLSVGACSGRITPLPALGNNTITPLPALGNTITR
eukprot:645680-Prorocentrum_minimum.AAC.2